MPYCPNCLERYRSGVKICPDCEVDLIDGNPPKKEGDEPDRLLTVASYPFEELAYLGKAKLESEGIWSMVGNAYSRGGGGLGLFFGGGGIQLQVRESDFDEATRILEEVNEVNVEREENYDNESEVDEEANNDEFESLSNESRRCPGCNSLNTHAKFSFFHSKRKCESCGHEWERD
jgi:hypothetical protein